MLQMATPHMQTPHMPMGEMQQWQPTAQMQQWQPTPQLPQMGWRTRYCLLGEPPSATKKRKVGRPAEAHAASAPRTLECES